MDVESAARVKKYLDVFFHRKWWVVIPTVLSIAAAPFVFEALPKMYKASTTVLVSQQTFSRDVAESTVTATVAERVANLAVQILSNTFLQTVVEELQLVPAGAGDLKIQAAARRLKSRISLEHDPQQLSWFKVVAIDEDPEQSAMIANRLAQLFIEQNSRWRAEQASVATATVDKWIDERRTQLDAEEQTIAAFREKHLFELPEHLNANLQLLKSAEERRSNLSREIQGRIDQLTILRAQTRNESNDPLVLAGERNADPGLREFAQLQEELRELRVRYTEENPLVRNKVAEIAGLKAARPDLFEARAPGQENAAGATGLKGDIVRLVQEQQSREEERAAVQREIATYTARINKTPIREQELKSLTRDYDILQAEYENLLRKREITTRGEDLEAAKRGDHFRVQDPAVVPARPFRPVFMQILVLCIVVGLGAGLGSRRAARVSRSDLQE